MKSDVYFIEVKSGDIEKRTIALKRLLEVVNPFSDYNDDEIVPVKITLGDSKCIYNIHYEMVKSVITALKKKKTRPFIFDTNVIYKGKRLNAVDHLMLANTKGFSHSKVGAPFIIADGLFGQDGKEYEIRSTHLSRIKVPSFIGMLDSLVVLSHVTGHILSGYAGAIKNVAMGMVCKPSKQVQHSSLKPHVIKERCTACGCCINICPPGAISLKDGKAFIDKQNCVGCGECLCACKFDAIFINWGEEVFIFCQRMVEAANLVLSKFKNKFFINFALDITKECDCISEKGEKIISRDLGILASHDIVSLDKATLDLANKDEDIFLKAQGKGEHYKMIEYAFKKGLGNIEYNLQVVF